MLLRPIEQYLRPAIAVPAHVKHPSVKLKVAAVEPPQVSVAETGLVGNPEAAYAPGSVTDVIAVTLPPEMVAVNVAGVGVPLT